MVELHRLVDELPPPVWAILTLTAWRGDVAGLALVVDFYNSIIFYSR